MSTNDRVIEITGSIVASYLGNNHLPASEIPKLVADTYIAVRRLDSAEQPAAEAEPVTLSPAVPIKKSITPDFIICLEDGKKFKSLKRHLSTAYGMTPEQYRAKWGLNSEYPMVAPNYSATRSTLAKDNGLGRQRLNG